jgi:RimJ/RimL family protein N-acetyltransferase
MIGFTYDNQINNSVTTLSASYMGSVIAERTFDKDVIASIMTTPDIWDTIAEDGSNIDDFSADCDGECWVLMTVDNDVIGAYNLHPHNSVTLEIHAHVLPEYRNAYSGDTGTAILQWFLDNSPNKYEKIIAQIPVIYDNVKRFTCSFGFQEEGVNRLSYKKNGNIIDQWLLGITRTEIEDFLHE